MGSAKTPAELVYTRWERFLNAQSEAFGGDRELTELSSKLHEFRSVIYADAEVSSAELAVLAEKLEAVAALYSRMAGRKGIVLDGSLPASRESFRVFREEAEIHYQTLAGEDGRHYRGGLLQRLLAAPDPDPVTQRIVLDLVCSASAAIASDKVHLLRAQLSLLDHAGSQRRLLEGVRRHLARELDRPVWKSSSRGPAIDLDAFDRAANYSSVAAVQPVALPRELRATNRMMPNHPVSGRDVETRSAVRALLQALRTSGRLFLDRIEPGQAPADIAVKIDLNLGIEGAPSVTDPAATYAVLSELLALGEARGLPLRFTVGDSNGIENATVGRTTLDVMRDTGNYHAALKAALGFAARPSMPESVRSQAAASLDKLLHLEGLAPPVYFGSPEDRISSHRDRMAAEQAAAPWVVCVDYDQTGFRPIQAGLGPLGRAIWGSNQFHVAEPWVTADYRVHVSRGVSTHLFAGWTGALKGLIGLHVLGGRPGDRGMKQRGDNLLDVLSAVMRTGSFTGILAARSGVTDFPALAAGSEDPRVRSAVRQSNSRWEEISRLTAGRAVWAKGAAALESELRRDQKAGVPDMELMARMRRGTTALLEEAEKASPGFRGLLWQGVADGTRAFLLTMWKCRECLPAAMRDERMGLRIGLLARLPHQSDLVVQALPKVGIGGGPDAYFEVRDVGIVVAGEDEITVDLIAMREARLEGHPWSMNHPVHGALQFGPGPISWDEIRTLPSSMSAEGGI